MPKKYIHSIVGLSLFILSSSLFALQGFEPGLKYVPGEFIVKFKEGAERAAPQSLQGLGMELSHKVGQKSGLHVLKLNDRAAALEALKISPLVSKRGLDREIADRLSQSSLFEYVEPNYIYTIADFKPSAMPVIQEDEEPVVDPVLPNDAMFGQLWGMHNIGQTDSDGTTGNEGADIDAPRAWGNSTDASDIVVAVIDTGVDYTHEDLAANAWVGEDPETGATIHGYNAINDTLDPMDDHSHGSHCAGSIGGVGNNGIGVAGVAWNVQLMGVKFLSASGSGTLEDAIKAIDWATENGADIMSNSWGGGGYSEALKESIVRANEAGILFVAAAGNSASDNDSRPAYPATYQVDNVVSVAASTNTDVLASFSSFGKNTVHVAAPGHNVVSSVPGNGYSSFSGTSMATPHVSGAAALFLANRGAGMTPLQVREEIVKSSERVAAFKRKVSANGSRLNLYNLLEGIYTPMPVPVPEEEWSENVEVLVESEHPYQNEIVEEWEITRPGVNFIKLHFSSFDVERGYDKLTLIDATSGEVLEEYTGTLGEFWTSDIPSDHVILRLTSDRSITKEGFVVDGFKWSNFDPNQGE